MTIIEPLSGHELLVLFLQLFLLLFTARTLGGLVKQLNYPAVLGELLAGVILGPSIFGALAPTLFTTVFPQTPAQYHLIEVVAWIGLVMLLILTGLEMDLGLVASRLRPAVLISLSGIVIPFVTGFALGQVLPAQFLAGGDQRLVFSLFLAVAMSISAIPVIAKVLIDLDVINREIGQITVAAGMIDDTIGWILLSIVAGLATAGGSAVFGTAGETALLVLLFLGVAFTLGRWGAERIMRWVDHVVGGEMAKISTVVILALGVGTITHAMGVEVVLGAFVVGLLFSDVTHFDQATRRTFETFTLSVLAPVFFAIAGLRVDLTTMADPVVLAGGAAVLAIAIIGKFVGASLGAKLAGLSNWEGITLGAGMNARGAIELIVAVIGLSIGVLTVEMYSIIVMVAVVTSLMAPPLLRWSFDRVDMSDEEAERLEQEAFERESFLGGITHVLLPTRCGADAQLAAQLIGRIAQNRDIEITSMYVSRVDEAEPSGGTLARKLKRVVGRSAAGVQQIQNGNDSDRPESQTTEEENTAEGCLDLMKNQLSRSGTKMVRDVVQNVESSASDTVLTEAAEYDLLAIGVSTGTPSTDGSLFTTEIDTIIQNTPCPLLTVSSNEEATSHDKPLDEISIRRILLPTVGAEYNRHAAEVAFAIATNCDALVEITHVINRPKVTDRDGLLGEPDVSEAIELGKEIVDREVELGRTMGAEVLTDVFVGEQPERDIVDQAADTDVDLIVLSSPIRSTSRRAFFGHRVEYIVRHAPCPVLVLSSI